MGAGALGCEFLKNFACMGVACELPGGAGVGEVTVTDDDVIEKSNLSRQFLFRDWDIGSSKSTVAGKAAQKLNPGFHVRPLQNRVSPETETVFDDKFWQVGYGYCCKGPGQPACCGRSCAPGSTGSTEPCQMQRKRGFFTGPCKYRPPLVKPQLVWRARVAYARYT